MHWTLRTAIVYSLVLAMLTTVHASAVVRTPQMRTGSEGAASLTVYVSAQGTSAVNIYSAHGKLRGRITGFGDPVGLAVDGSGNLYVADALRNVVDVFKRGQHKPFSVLQDGTQSPRDVAVGTDGSVYASNITNGSPGTISVWKPGSTKVSYVISDPNIFDFVGLTLDDKNDLYAAWYTNMGTGGVDRVAPGSKKAKSLGLQGLAVPLDVKLDAHDRLVVADAGCACIQVFAHHSTVPGRTISGFSQPTELAFDPTQRLLFVTDAQAGDVPVLVYGSGAVKETISQGLSASNYPWGVAIDPPAPL